MKALEKLSLTKELRGLLGGLSGQKGMAKLQAAKRIREIVALLAGQPQPADPMPLLQGIINGTINTFAEKNRLTELQMAFNGAGGDGIADGELKDLFGQAVRAAGIQQLEGAGYKLVA